jgi:hypothetical protein
VLELYNQWRRKHFPASKADLAWRHEDLATRLAMMEDGARRRFDAIEQLLKQNSMDQLEAHRCLRGLILDQLDGVSVSDHARGETRDTEHKQCISLPIRLEIVVPVYNAEPWLDVICDGYVALNIDPLFVVDSRSSDRSLDILVARECRVMIAKGEYPRVESLLFTLIPRLRNPWILRFDDDELPSKELIDWVRLNLSSLEAPAVSFPRHWVAPDRLSTGWVKSHGWDLDRQFRLFASKRVKLIEEIHTPGFEAASTIAAPINACIYHFDWLVRDHDERLKKIQAYDGQREGAGSAFRKFYLPEDCDPDVYEFFPLDDPMIQNVASRLKKPGLSNEGFWTSSAKTHERHK